MIHTPMKLIRFSPSDQITFTPSPWGFTCRHGPPAHVLMLASIDTRDNFLPNIFTHPSPSPFQFFHLVIFFDLQHKENSTTKWTPLGRPPRYSSWNHKWKWPRTCAIEYAAEFSHRQTIQWFPNTNGLIVFSIPVQLNRELFYSASAREILATKFLRIFFQFSVLSHVTLILPHNSLKNHKFSFIPFSQIQILQNTQDCSLNSYSLPRHYSVNAF